jgi:replication fork clamp-binding protein CrfC
MGTARSAVDTGDASRSKHNAEGVAVVEALGQLVERALAVAKGADRKDLTDRLTNTQRRLADPSVRVLVVGEFKQGKSLLVNALLGTTICPIDDDIATSVPTVVRHGEATSATLVFGEITGAPAGDDITRPMRPTERRSVPVDDLSKYVAEAGNPSNERKLSFAEVTLPRRFLAGGLVIVDTPGVGGIGSAHSAATLAALPTADAVLMISDAAQEYSEPEISFLRQAMKLCPNVACVLTKTDLYPQWRTVAELDRQHLIKAGIDAPLLPVSSTLRIHALDTKDADLNVESGFRALSDHLQQNVLARTSDLARRSVVNDVQYVTEHLSLAIQGEIAALRDPSHNQEFVAELEKARSKANALRKRSARWQNVLNDGITDLIADIEYDFRDRSRIITREAEAIIDASDPGDIWTQFSEWLMQRTAAAVGDNFVWAHERSEWLAGQVSECFAESGANGLPQVLVSDTAGVLDPVGDLGDVPRDRTTMGGKILIGMRGSYGGVLMFGLLTGAMGMALLNPFSLGAGVMLGVKAYRDDRQNRVARRQNEAKNIVRRQIDDVSLHVIKQAKDRLRQVQRTLRDHFGEIAEELHRSLSDSIDAAQRAAKTSVADRDRRITELKLKLTQIEGIQKQTLVLLPGPGVRKELAA